MKPTPLVASALLLVLAAPGCVGLRALEVELPGTIHQGAGPLQFSASGFAAVYGQLVHLPRAQEDRRFGVVVVDLAPLPPGWRPPHAREGGLLVSAVDRASPLAAAGLRSLDRILTVDGEEVADPQAVVAVLEEAERVELGIRRPDGTDATIAAEASDGVREATAWQVPLLVGGASSATGSGFTFGPFGTLFATRSALLTDDVRYVERTEWGALFDVLRYESETDVATGETRGAFSLFWFLSFGDEAVD